MWLMMGFWEQMKMKLKYRFVQRQVGGNWVAVAVGPDHEKFNGMVKLNNTGAFIMSLLIQGEQSRESLLCAMLERYDVDRERAEKNLDNVLDHLRQGGLLVE